MSNINIITNSIVNDYLSFVGKGESGKSFLTPQEYLLFRTQAIEELKVGIHTLPVVTENKSSQPTKEKIPDVSPKENETPETVPTKRKTPVSEPPTGKIIPISQAGKAQDVKTNSMLECMKKMDG